MKILLAVVIDDHGQLGLQCSEPDYFRAQGLCVFASDTLKEMATQAAAKTPGILLARGNLPPTNGHGN